MATLAKDLPQKLKELKLSPQQQQIVELSVTKNMTINQIASVLKISPQAVRKQMQRIIEKHEQLEQAAQQKTKQETKVVDTTLPRVNLCPTKEQIESMFETRVAQVLYLKTVCQKSHSEIAELLGITVGSVKQICHRSKSQQLHRKFDDPNELYRAYKDAPSPQKELKEKQAAGRLFYRHFVTGENTAPTRDVLRSLALEQVGGPAARRVITKDRAVLLSILIEASRGNIVKLDDPKIIRIARPILDAYFTQVAPGVFKPTRGDAIRVLQQYIESVS